MPSLLFRSTYLQLCPPIPLFHLEICLKAFHALHGLKTFNVVADRHRRLSHKRLPLLSPIWMFPRRWLGFRGWGPQLHGQERSSQWVWSKYFEQERKKREKRLHIILQNCSMLWRRWCLQLHGRPWKGKKSGSKNRNCFKGDFPVSLSFRSSQRVIRGRWFFQDFLSISHIKCKIFPFVLEARCFGRGRRPWHT